MASASAESNGTQQTEEELRLEIEILKRKLKNLTNDASGPRPVDDDADGVPSSPARSVFAAPSVPTATNAPPEKSGYLFKWRDRSIGWGGTKWGLRFVRLDRGRLSYYGSHEERSPRYVLALKDCAVRDEGSKANARHSGHGKRASSSVGGGGGGGDDSPKSSAGLGSSSEATPHHHETGPHFHVFSIYQRHARTNVIAEDGAEDDRSDSEEDVVPLLRFSTQSYAEKVQWIDLISQSCAYCDSEEFALESSRGPKRRDEKQKQRGTLPALIFETPSLVSRQPSGRGLGHKGKSFRFKSSAKDAARSNKISYPPSKPMHRKASPSYLSPEGADAQNYRGMFNLLLIILFVSNYRLLHEAVARHGFVLDELATLRGFSLSEAPLADFPFFSGLLAVQACVVGSYLVELALSRGWVGESFGMALHFANTNATLLASVAIVWNLIDRPVVGATLIMQAVITWLKLISYAHANRDYRAARRRQSSGGDAHRATMALVKDLDEEGLTISYPENVTPRNVYYFWLAPTLTYQIAFPRAPFVRWTKAAGLAVQLFASATLVAFLAAQVVAPNLDGLVRDLEANRGRVRTHVIGDYLLKLSITSTYIWLLGFYGFFHCFLNLSAELLRFGDRVFYKDWWNASEVSAYWRLWNMPVHYWLVRHVYFPSVRIGLSKTGATFVVFFLSAVLHEVLISVPCHMIRVHSFLAMMGQIPLIFLTKVIDKRYPGSSIGNVIFWISFCFVGQPMAMLLYTIDYWEMHHQDDLHGIDEIEVNNVSKFGIPFAAIGKLFGASPEL